MIPIKPIIYHEHESNYEPDVTFLFLTWNSINFIQIFYTDSYNNWPLSHQDGCGDFTPVVNF